LELNPHFRRAGVSTTNSKSMMSAPKNGEIDLNGLDMTNPEHRKLYKEAKLKGLL